MPRLALLLPFVLLLALAVGLPTPAAANPVRTDHVEADLRAELPAAVPGEPLWLAVTQRIRPGWHTYWKNPGDSGIATEVTWTLPPGWQAGPLVWPAPERFPVGPLVNFGYKDEVHLLTRVDVPADAAPGGTVTIVAQADWLVCEDICIPESARLELTLPVAAGPVAPTPERAALFAQARRSLPVPSPFPATFLAGETAHQLVLSTGDLAGAELADAFFFPEHWSVTPAAAPQELRLDADGVRLVLPRSGALPAESVKGVLLLTERLEGREIRQALEIDAPIEAVPASGSPAPGRAAADTAALGVGLALLLALAGGAILNLMPCVFPVLSIKVLALVSHAPGRAPVHGAAYAAGVLATFAAVAGLLLALRAGGAQIGWGFQLQDPLVVAVLAYVMFLLGLWLSGVYELGGGAQGLGQGLAARGGYAGSFFTGVLATVVATPCTAPFMGTAVGFALLQPWPLALSVFLALGLGMALPFLLLTLSPALLRRMPRPGLWMERLKQALAFPLYATAVWLVWVLSIQAGPDAVAWVLGGMVLVAFAAWLYGVTRSSGTGWRLGASVFGVLALAGAVAMARVPALAGPAVPPPPSGTAAAAGDSVPFDEAALAALRAEGRPVFVNFTAAWCITCLVNERTSLSADAVKQAMAAKGVAYLKGDWTNRDAGIARVLEGFGRSGVPLYLLYRPGEAEPEVLPQILTPGLVLEALEALPDRAP
ncbi:protein-disulfide reductase DsbD family protein [Rhodospirillum centenum]|uniref:Thiol:disulfide interchange protein DsbD, putative n=1 Tax=Rhodospirillum centenum (strain ATCC 51521 / SW) TaxID=414684 RepID=B6IRI6_RHOCS|nr:protein-disulfide reductase DsbD domain-containing protein [Rhodospirillum centenum]ACI98072.1 thiol:disulfide interchange protein DsbD, putative [Rhodospirillum centenum SW]